LGSVEEDRMPKSLPRSLMPLTLPAILLALASCSSVSDGQRQGITDPTTPMLNVNGSSFVTTGGAEITLVVDGFTQRWSFNAKGIDAKGRFNVVFRHFGQTVHVKGDILCYSIWNNRARVGGVVTSSNTPGFAGTEAVWTVEDNGEGSLLDADRITPYQAPVEDIAARAYCDVPAVPDGTTMPINSGNVQVHE
jgi:hypothetical protein